VCPTFERHPDSGFRYLFNLDRHRQGRHGM
jgi:hypothetical protein